MSGAFAYRQPCQLCHESEVAQRAQLGRRTANSARIVHQPRGCAGLRQSVFLHAMVSPILLNAFARVGDTPNGAEAGTPRANGGVSLRRYSAEDLQLQFAWPMEMAR